MAPKSSWAIFRWAMMSMTSIAQHWASWSILSYNHVSVPGLAFEPMSSKAHQAHQAHIALSEQMFSTVQQGSSLGSSPTSLSLNSHYKPTFGSLTLCQLLFGGRQRQINRRRCLFFSRASRSRTDSRPNGSRLRLGHLWVGNDIIDKHCIGLELLVQFKLQSSIPTRTHQAHIALSEPISSIDQQGSSLDLCPAFLFLNPTINRFWVTDHVSSPIWWEEEINIESTVTLVRVQRRGICSLFQQYGICVLKTKPSCRMWSLCPHH